MDFEEYSLDEPRQSKSAQSSSGSPGDKPKLEISPQEALAVKVSRLVLGLILLIAFAVGCWVAATALHHPDACWFLAMGRWIFEHGAVPDLDPFAWPMAADGVKGHPFVVDQWLSALISYLSTLSGGLLTLLMLNAVVIVTAYLSLPLGFVVRRGAPFVPGLLLVLVALLTAFLCPTDCTQIFSYLFVALFLQVLHHARSAMLWHDDKVFRIAYVLVPLMVLWANLHPAFVIGLILLALCLLATQLSKPFLRARSSEPVDKALTVELSIAFVWAFLASFATPYGWNIWLSMPDSLMALSSAPFASQTLLPYLGYANSLYAAGLYGLLAVVFVLLVVREFYACGKKKSSADSLVISELVTAGLIGGLSIALTVVCPRLIVFTVLILLSEVLTLLGLRRLAAHAEAQITESVSQANAAESPPIAEQAPSKKRTFWQDLNFHSLDVWLAGGAFELAIVSFCSIAGVCLVANKVHKPELPANNKFEEISFSRLFANPNSALSAPGSPYRTPNGPPPALPAYTPSAAKTDNLSAKLAEKSSEVPESKALLFIEKNRNLLGERLFNDAAYGSLIDWQLRAVPKVFIDTRFCGYERRIVDDYQAIEEASPRWQQLVDGYAIDSVFVPLTAPLARALAKDTSWTSIYSDEQAVIFVRKPVSH